MKRLVRSAFQVGAEAVLTKLARSLEVGSLHVEFPNGKREDFGQKMAEPHAFMRIHDYRFYGEVLRHGEIGFGDSYVEGYWDANDLVAMLELGILNRQRLSFNNRWLSLPGRVRSRRAHRRNRNTLEGSKHNIHAHYDLSNDFFGLWLDESRSYSCALYEREDQSLEDAQVNKYRSLAEKAGIKASDHVLDVGCGWGGFSVWLAKTYGCRMTGITISREQYEFARALVAKEGLIGQVEIQFRDYRHLDGQKFDKIFVVEVLEQLGADFYPTFYACMDEALEEQGRLVIQTISVPERSFESLRDGVNWTQLNIFPGGDLTSLAEIERSVSATRLLVGHAEDIGLHYVRTLQEWRERFNRTWDEIQQLDQRFDERFRRKWEYYLVSSEAGFKTRILQDWQVVLTKPGGGILVPVGWHEAVQTAVG